MSLDVRVDEVREASQVLRSCVDAKRRPRRETQRQRR